MPLKDSDLLDLAHAWVKGATYAEAGARHGISAWRAKNLIATQLTPEDRATRNWRLGTRGRFISRGERR